MAESYSVKAVLSVEDNMTNGFERAAGASQSLGSRLKSTISLGGAMAVGMKAVNGVLNTVSGSIGNAVSRFDTLNNFPKIMENMGISGEEAGAQLERASEAMANLPTALDDAASGIQRFTSSNGDVKKSTDYFLALNDAIIAGGQSSGVQQSALEQLSQAYSKGKMDMMEWRSIQQAMPAQLNQIAQAMGMTASELGEGLRSGSISMDEFMGKIVELDQNGSNGFKSFKEQAEASCDGINTAITNVKTAITRGIANAFTSVDEALQSNGFMTIGQTINSVIPYIDNFSSKVGGLVTTLGSMLSGKASPAEIGKQLTEGLVGAFEKVTDGLGDTAKGMLSKVTTTITKYAPSLAEGILNALPGMIEAGGKLLLGIAEGITQNAPKLLTAAVKLVPKIVAGIVKALPTVLSVGVRLITTLTKGVLSMVGYAAKGALSVAKKMISSIGSGIKNVASIGKNIITGLWSGASSMVSWVVGKFKSLGSSILSGIKSALGIHSPSRVFRDQVGKNIMLGIVEGIENTRMVVNTAFDNVMPKSNGLAFAGSSSVTNFTGDIIIQAKDVKEAKEAGDLLALLLEGKEQA